MLDVYRLRPMCAVWHQKDMRSAAPRCPFLRAYFGRVCFAWLVVWMPLTSVNAAPPEPHHRHATLDARIGTGLVDGRRFDALAMYLGVSTFYFGLGFYEESTTRQQSDEMLIEGLRLTGTRTRRTLQLPFVFGAEVYRNPGRYVDLRIDGQFKGGLELEFNHLRTSMDERIPGTPEANYFLGGGIRTQLVHPIGRWLSNDLLLFKSWYIGASSELDLCFRQLGIESMPDRVYVSFLGFVVLGSKKLAFL